MRAEPGLRVYSTVGSPNVVAAQVGLAEQFSSKENIQVEGKSNIQMKVVTTLFAEVERDLISERTPRGPCPGSGPRAGSSVARKGSLGVFTARRLRRTEIQHFLELGQAEPLQCISARTWSVPCQWRRATQGLSG